METETKARPVRVTIDGWLTECLDSHGKPTKAVRVKYDHPDREASTLLLTDSPHVTVEDRTLPRVWTDGDVVQNIATNHVQVRGIDTGWSERGDSAATDWVERGTHRVLRYQAGE